MKALVYKLQDHIQSKGLYSLEEDLWHHVGDIDQDDTKIKENLDNFAEELENDIEVMQELLRMISGDNHGEK